MTDEKKKELFPYFAYLYSQQINPDKYGSVSSPEEWTNLIQDNEEDLNTITEAATKLTDEDWNTLEEQYNSKNDESPQLAAKGTKLRQLKNSVKKCKCGCEAILVKEEGGKFSYKCPPCKDTKSNVKSKRIGGTIEKPTDNIDIVEVTRQILKCGGKVKKKQQGGDVVDTSSRIGVARQGLVSKRLFKNNKK